MRITRITPITLFLIMFYILNSVYALAIISNISDCIVTAKVVGLEENENNRIKLLILDIGSASFCPLEEGEVYSGPNWYPPQGNSPGAFSIEDIIVSSVQGGMTLSPHGKVVTWAQWENIRYQNGEKIMYKSNYVTSLQTSNEPVGYSKIPILNELVLTIEDVFVYVKRYFCILPFLTLITTFVLLIKSKGR